MFFLLHRSIPLLHQNLHRHTFLTMFFSLKSKSFSWLHNNVHVINLILLLLPSQVELNYVINQMLVREKIEKTNFQIKQTKLCFYT